MKPSRLVNRCKLLALWLYHGQFGAAWTALRGRLYGERVFLVLRRDLTAPFAPPPAALFSAGRRPVTVRPLRESDVATLFDLKAPGITKEGARHRLAHLALLQKGLSTCYVAVTPDDRPCYMQWLIPARQNARFQAWTNSFPPLAPDEALVDYAFTLEAYRGQGVMASAMAQIAQRAADCGARWAITYVRPGNVSVLKSCKRAGFAPYAMHRETWRLFRRRVTVTPVPGREDARPSLVRA